MTEPITKMNPVDSLTVFNEVIAPTAAKGVVIRRPPMEAMAERFDWDTRAVRRLQRMRNKYGPGPVMLSTMGQPRAFILSPTHVRRVLEESPEVFSTASSEKVAALSHFEPKNALITEGWKQAERQRFNDQVLDSDRNVHRLADLFLGYVHDEAEYLIQREKRSGRIGWDEFYESWFRAIRRVVFGDQAADDRELLDMMERLRAAGNWAFMHPGYAGLRDRLHDRVKRHLDRAEEGSLAARIKEIETTREMAPHHQVPQYLFAADPAGMTTFRTMALLAAHPDALVRAQAEVDSHGGPARADLPYLRACVLESLRLWPTTPLILRQTLEETRWDGRVMPKGTGLIIFTPFFHRDDENLSYADRFAPEIWLEGDGQDKEWPLIPFSGGPAICPARNFVLMMASAMTAGFLEQHDLRLVPPDRLRGDRQMPGVLNHFDLRFELVPRDSRQRMPTEIREQARATETSPKPVRGVGRVRAHAGQPGS